MSLFTLLYPCLSLAQLADPMSLASRLAANGEPPSYKDVYNAIHQEVEVLLAQLEALSHRAGTEHDVRWYWAAPVLLDRQFSPKPVQRWLAEQAEPLAWETMVRSRTTEGDPLFSQHLTQLRTILQDPAGLDPELGSPPDDLADVLTKLTLASPAVVTLRSLLRHWPNTDDASTSSFLSAAARVAMGFRTMFNLPESITLIRNPDDPDDPDDIQTHGAHYWQRVLDYAIDGNLQAVMDEYVHILYEALGLSNVAPDEAVQLLASTIHDALSLRTITLSVDDLRLDANTIKIDDYRVRCRYALPFGQRRYDDEAGGTRDDQVRIAFNSPFRPFILATTSIGQEGLDFHQYCHAVYHWNLPSNPVDLEQREGRVHRYKGHVIRKNVAQHYGLSALSAQVAPFEDPWTVLFKQAEDDRPEPNDLVPYWIYEEGDFRIERHVPALPLSRELEQLENLKSAVVAYRMVFGQPRQEDLLSYLQSKLSGDVELEDLLKFRIDLTPPRRL